MVPKSKLFSLSFISFFLSSSPFYFQLNGRNPKKRGKANQQKLQTLQHLSTERLEAASINFPKLSFQRIRVIFLHLVEYKLATYIYFPNLESALLDHNNRMTWCCSVILTLSSIKIEYYNFRCKHFFYYMSSKNVYTLFICNNFEYKTQLYRSCIPNNVNLKLIPKMIKI